MCRSKSDPRGYYRCIPSSGFLAMTSSPDLINPGQINYTRGAFWHNEADVPTIEDILYVIENLNEDGRMDLYLHRSKMNEETKKMENQYDKLVHEYCHLGNMVASLVDSRVPHFNKRLLTIQSLVADFNKMKRSDDVNDEKLDMMENEIADKSLSLGYDVQTNTQNVLQELNIRGQTIDGTLLRGHEKLQKLFVENSTYFPAQWNSQLKSNKKIRQVKAKHPSSYTSPHSGKYLHHIGAFKISEGTDGVFCYPSLEEAQKAKKEDLLAFNSKHEIVHEMTHMFEKGSPYIKAATSRFLLQRIVNDKGKAYLHPRLGDDVDPVYVDSFASPHTGTMYGRDPKVNEVMARGTEAVLLGTNGSLIGLPKTSSMLGDKESLVVDIVPDIDHRNLTLGILAGAKINIPL